jgi:hypothetical protein
MNDTTFIKQNIRKLISNKNKALNKLVEYIYQLDDYELIDIYYDLKDYSINMAIEFALNIIIMVGKRNIKDIYFEETFFENIELELFYNGNDETIKILNEYIQKENNIKVKKIFTQYLDIIVSKYKNLGLERK